MLKFAFNRRGCLVPSNEATHGEDYWCPCCGAVVRLKISKRGVPFFFCCHSVHTEKDCAWFAEQMTDYATDDINIRSIMIGMIREPGDGPQDHPKLGKKGPQKPVVGLTTMHRLWMVGVPYGDPDMPVHGGRLVDYLIGPKAFREHLSGNDQIGQRIIMAMPEKILSRNRIRFRCPWVNFVSGKTVYDNKRLTLCFSDSELFERNCSNMFVKNDSGDLVSQYQYVLIAADWRNITKSECGTYCYKCRHGSLCCGMLVAECNSTKQIYVPRTHKNQLMIK